MNNEQVFEMTEQEKGMVKAWVRNWEELGPILEDIRQDALKRVDTSEAVEAFELSYKSARLHCPPRQTSGLVEQQRWFMLARR